ncbi:MAG: polysaccharide deacetylase family protein [Rhodospirillaceae bacterium]|nr:polysaccharide deacetylase family protein [Rhodospirillaceae bacterium]MBT4590310.1 polysaccharide deacetylase family protein [Rhodospirillaceae bacterium]MBT4940993.1 polysaccharide deacetylase family protein [Rhodospirillaceae bacterium]MBT5938917.1 polysaccharide deacetylase family protein [Rhodospirillaceae bacterium]MBT7268932.1 polysaccharide deacetylase family protein [Rhodospirillaceae bacterium]
MIKADGSTLIKSLLLGSLVLSALGVISTRAEARSSAVILMYHRFGETAFPSTNIRLKQFDKHIEELSNGTYTVWPVTKIIAAIRKGEDLPDRTVGITVDDGFRSVYTEAWPRLKKAGLPFTVFVATAPINRGSNNYMSWDQIRTLKKAGVEIGAHTASHNHMPASDAARNEAELENSNARMIQEIGAAPVLFAYPFGEASLKAQKLVRQKGYKMAFGQHSGVVNTSTDFNYIPRFALNENYGDINRLRLVLNALPLPANDITPADPLIAKNNPPDFGFTVAASVKNLHRLACFSSSEGRVRVERLGPRIEVRMTNAFPKGRTRINCTLPGPENRWHWFGTLFVVPQ